MDIVFSVFVVVEVGGVGEDAEYEWSRLAIEEVFEGDGGAGCRCDHVEYFVGYVVGIDVANLAFLVEYA